MSEITVREFAFDLGRAVFVFPRWALAPACYVLAWAMAGHVWAWSKPWTVLTSAVLMLGMFGAAKLAKVPGHGWRLFACDLMAFAGLVVTGVLTALHHADWARYCATLAGLCILAAAVLWAKRYAIPQGSTAKTLANMDELDQTFGNAASRFDVWQYCSPSALLAQAANLRPSFEGLGRRELRRRGAHALGSMLLRLGLGLLPGEQVWANAEEVTGVEAPPRTGKTAMLACVLNDAPGAVVTTSTRPDLSEWGHEERSKRGPSYFWNPVELLDVPSIIMGGPDDGKPVQFPVLAGCQVASTAQRRASLMVPGNGDSRDARWDNSARSLLACLLEAAALEPHRYDMFDVQRWVADTPDAQGECESLREIVAALSKGKGNVRARIATVRQHYGTHEGPRDSTAFTLRNQALEWLNNDKAAKLGSGKASDATLDLYELVRNGWTLHLLGRDEGGAGPLNACLVGELAHVARDIAGKMPRQRLDPPMTMILDECAISCPVPLHDWTSDFGGSGITIYYSVQSLGQLDDRYGAEKASVTRSNTNNLVRLGGGNDGEALEDAAKLAGQTRRKVVGPDIDHGLEDHRWTDTVGADRIRALPRFHGIVYRGGMRVAEGRIPRVWKRRRWVRSGWLWRRVGIKRATLGLAAQAMEAAAAGLVDVEVSGNTGELTLPRQRKSSTTSPRAWLRRQRNAQEATKAAPTTKAKAKDEEAAR